MWGIMNRLFGGRRTQYGASAAIWRQLRLRSLLLDLFRAQESERVTPAQFIDSLTDFEAAEICAAIYSLARSRAIFDSRYDTKESV